MKSILITALALTLVACANYTPEQMTAMTSGITSVITTTGQVVTPLVINYANGKRVRVARPTPTPKPKKHGRPTPSPK